MSIEQKQIYAMNNTEETIKTLIKESIMKRIEGLGRIDNILNDSALIECWLTDIMALGYNQSNIETAVRDLYEIQYPLKGAQSFEYLRARLSLTMNRFPDEVMAFQTYAENRSIDNDDSIVKKVKEQLSDVPSGDFMFS